MLDQEHRDLAWKRGDGFDELRSLGLGNAGGRLVEEQHARAARESERDLEKALLAVGEAPGASIEHIRQAKASGDLRDLLDNVSARPCGSTNSCRRRAAR